MLLINKTLLRMSKGFRGWIVLIALLKVMVLVGMTMFANSIGGVLGQLFDLESLNSEAIKNQLVMAFIASLMMLLGDVLVGEAEHRCTAKARICIRKQIFSKVLELDVGDVDVLGATSTINSAVDGVETMQQYYNRYLPGLLYSVIAPVYLFFAIKDKCLAAAVLLLVLALGVTPLNNFFRVIIDKLKTDYWQSLGDLTSYYLESINSLTTTELFGRGPDREKTLKGKTQHLSDIIIGVMKINFSSIGMSEVIMNVGIVGATVIVCTQLIAGKIDLVAALTVLLLSYSFFGSIRSLQWIAHSALMGIAAAQNVASILDIDTERPLVPDENPEMGFEGIRLENVSFAYKGRNNVLKNVSIEIPKGETVAIAGESGCGKSTIVNMLLRFYDARDGKITLDGRNYSSLDPAALRRRIIMVPQYVYVFSGTLRENLLIADKDATEAELYEVLERVKLADWVRSNPEGLDFNVGEAGSRLSGGQRQKVGIARALLCRAEYIIFDEATSSVDEESERKIWACIDELSETRTLIIISHRLSTIRNAKRIYVLEDGCVAEHGDHESLMKNGGLYSRLVREQEQLEAHCGRRVRV